MQSAGGFIIDDWASVLAAEKSTLEHQPTQASTETTEEDVATPALLTTKQEAKLRSFLDDSLDNISRGYRKRFDPTSPLRSLSLYLAEWRRVLGVLARIPPYGSGSSNLLISYLLRCSTDLCDGIAGYGLSMEIEIHRRDLKSLKDQHESDTKPGTDDSNEVDDEEDRRLVMTLRHRQLNLILQTLDLVDRIWVTILRGNMINFSVALANSISAYPNPEDDEGGPKGQSGPPVRSKFEAARLTTSFVASPARDQRGTFAASLRESLPIHGGKGFRTVGVTDQVRLRNIAISSREKLFAWMRQELDAPAPPTVEDGTDQEPTDSTLEGALQQGTEVPIGSDGSATDDSIADQESQMEDVDIAAAEHDRPDPLSDTAEHRRFQSLFDRKIDPDEDEDDDDQNNAKSEEDVDNDDALGASVAGSIAAVRAESEGNLKRKRDTDDASDTEELASVKQRLGEMDGARQQPAAMSRSEVGSLDLNLSDGVGQWDLAFTRLFSRTLRTLSDFSEHGNKNAEAKTSMSNGSTHHISAPAHREVEDDDDD